MRSYFRATLIAPILLSFILYVVTGTTRASDTPADVASQLILAATRGQTSDVYRCFAFSTNVPPAYLSEQIKGMVQLFSDTNFTTEIVRAFTISNCALVVISCKGGSSSGSFPFNGFFLVRRNDSWLVLPDCGHAHFGRPINGLSESEVSTFTLLNTIMDMCQNVARNSSGNTDDLIKLLRRDTSREDFAGTWSGGLALRKDGRGVWGGCALRWRKTDTGIRVVVGVEGESRDLKLSFNRDDGTLVGESEGERRVQLKISADEPADYEGEVEKELQQGLDRARQNRPHIKTNTYEKAEDMFAALRTFTATNDFRMTMRSEKDPTQSIQVSSYNVSTLIEICCRKGIQLPQKGNDDFWGDQPPPVLKTVWRSDPPKVSLSETIYASTEKLDAYIAWLKGKNIAYNLQYLIAESRWRIEWYILYCSVSIPSNSDATAETVDFLMRDTLAPFEAPYRLEIIGR